MRRARHEADLLQLRDSSLLQRARRCLVRRLFQDRSAGEDRGRIED